MADDPARIDRDAEAARRRGMLARVAGRTRASAEIAFPAIPSLASHYTDILADHFAALGRPFAPNELDMLHGHLQAKLREAYDASPASQILVRYHTAAEGSSRNNTPCRSTTATLSFQRLRSSSSGAPA